ncbi:hypothetical protein GCU56_08515 [Geodermatophilus sabuli]|uniref:Uncharacterized protein n=1 Tax=Geodermatophilus sabuli TaxID=1564158 RepID=A0A7K3VZ85_9ACTN|nr:hypothetical protein [Geodermatophilus sabuli]NEK57912.1 hypothetical protein [Geodermatophilus sabuli]
MSDTAQTALTVVCHLVAVSAQLAGLALLARERRRTGTALRRWSEATPGAPDPAADRTALVEALRGNSFDRSSAIVLLAVGFGAAALGHLIGL